MILKRIGKLFPVKTRKSWSERLVYGGSTDSAEHVLGATTLGVIGGGILGAWLMSHFTSWHFAWGVVPGVVVVLIIAHVLLQIEVERRTTTIEAALPDALLLMSSNLNAGMSVDNALMEAGKQKLGVLRDELMKIGREVGYGKAVPAALNDFAARVRSDKLEKAVILINAGMRSGGELSVLLAQIAKNMRNQEIVEKKTRATIITYAMLIVIALALVAPILFALSVFLVELVQTAASDVALPTDATGTPFLLTSSTVTTEFLIGFSLAVLLTSSVLGSLLVGQITRGKMLFGAKYIPPLAIITTGLFFASKYLIEITLAGILGR